MIASAVNNDNPHLRSRAFSLVHIMVVLIVPGDVEGIIGLKHEKCQFPPKIF